MVRSSRHTTPYPKRREAGLTLIEVAVSLAVFTLIALGVSMTLIRGIDHREESFQSYRALNAVRNVVATIQDTANQPPDFANQLGIGSVYRRYDGQTIAVDDLPSGQVLITCFVDETAVPAIFGGPQDLNLDNDAQDDLGNLSAGTDLKLIPITLTLTWVEENGSRTMTVHRLITKTTG